MVQTVVVGCRGMLGQELMRQLQARGEVPVGVDLPDVDIGSWPSVFGCHALKTASALFNCAAYANVEKAEEEEPFATRVNGEGVANLAKLAGETGALLIHLSTDFVFAGDRRTPYPVDAPRQPQSAYARSKLAGEQALERSRCRWLLIRTAWLCGHGGKNFVETMLRIAKDHGQLEVVCDQIGSPTYAKDLAQALVELALGPSADRPMPRVFHCVNSGAASWHQLACEIVRLAGLQVPVLPLTTAEAIRKFKLKAHRPAYSVLDCSTLEQALGRTMRPWQAALAEYMATRSAEIR
jgi:dTDP-4-dehydrorhamnose reductase